LVQISSEFFLQVSDESRVHSKNYWVRTKEKQINYLISTVFPFILNRLPVSLWV